MVTIATTLWTNSPINMADSNLTNFESNLTATSTKFSWASGLGSPNAVYIHGSGFTYSGLGNGRELSGGAIAAIVLDRGNDNGSQTAGDLVITGTAGLNAANIRKGDDQAFWGEILKGDDTFNLAGLGEADVGFGANVFFGDDRRLFSGGFGSASDAGGNDLMVGADNEFHMTGDVSFVQGAAAGDFILPATYTGGDDRIFGAASDRRNNLIGDASLVGRFGEVIGGADIISASGNTSVSTSVTGDVDNLHELGFVRGGSDDISMGSAGVAAGDVLFMLGFGGFVIGGNDTIGGIKLKAAGDVYEIVSTTANATIQCGNDTITGGALDDIISGDILYRNSSSNTVTGGNDVLLGGDGNDQLSGELAAGLTLGVSGGNDRLDGGAGMDLLLGQYGNDTITDGTGTDLVFGGDGDDRLYVSADGENDTFDGSAGAADALDLMHATSGATVTFGATAGAAAGGGQGTTTFTGIERIYGSYHADTVTGGAANEYILLRDGNDTATGGAGADLFFGGIGQDRLGGGAGADIYAYVTAAESVDPLRDIITSWDATDTIDLARVDANVLLAGNQAFTIAPFAPATGQMRIVPVVSNGTVVLQMNTDADAAFEMVIAITTTLPVTAGDFVL